MLENATQEDPPLHSERPIKANPDGSRLHALGNEPMQMTRMMGTTWEIEIHTPEDPPKTPEHQAIQDKFQDA